MSALSSIIARRLGASTVINQPAIGALNLSGSAQPYAAVEVYKGSGNAMLGVAQADGAGIWQLSLSTAVAIGDIYRTASGGIVVAAGAAPLMIAGLPGSAYTAVPYSFAPVISGGKAPYSITYSVPAGATGKPTAFDVSSSTGLVSGLTAQTGVFTFRLIARDADGASAFLDVSIPVTASTGASSAVTAQINTFTTPSGSAASLAAWNDLNSTTAYGSSAVLLKDSNGALTGWTAAWTTAIDTGNNGGPTGVADTPDAVALTATFIDNNNANEPSKRSTATLRIAGLNTTKKYTIKTLSARSGAAGTGVRTTNVAAGGQLTSVNALGNLAYQTMPSLTPASDGTIDIVMTQGEATQFAYMNAVMVIQDGATSGGSTGGGVDVTPPIISTSANATVAENQPFSVTLSANETVTWAKVAGKDAALFTLVGAVLSMTAKDFEAPVDQGANNVYDVDLTATDTAGNVTTLNFHLTVSDVADTVPTKISSPTIAGKPMVGQSLYRTQGTYTNAPTSYTDQWYADGVAIAGATNWFFVPTTAEIGKVITIGDLATNAAGTSNAANLSAGTAVVAAQPAFAGPAIGTYAYNAKNSVKQFYDWLGYEPPGSFGDAHIGRGYNKVTFADAMADWIGSVDYVIDTCFWKGKGHRLDLALPMFPLMGGNFTDANAGAYDDAVKQIFNKILAKLGPLQDFIYVRIGWEMNNTFQPWSIAKSGAAFNVTDTALCDGYKAWFIRMVGLARAISDKFKFGFIANPGSFDFRKAYPGGAYVDYIGMDCYPGLNDKTVYRPPAIVSPSAQLAIWDQYRTMAFGMQDCRDFATAEGKPFAVPEFAYEFDNGQVGMDAFWNWCVAQNVAWVGWWNDSDIKNVLSGISGILTTDSQGVVNGQKTADIPGTGACVRYRWNQSAYTTQPQTPPYVPSNKVPSDLSLWSKSTAEGKLASPAETSYSGAAVYTLRPTDTSPNAQANSIHRINRNVSWTANQPLEVLIEAKADGEGFLLINGPEGADTGIYCVNLATGAVQVTTASASGTAAQMQAKITVTAQTGGWWLIRFVGKTIANFAYPFLHINKTAGGEQYYVASDLTLGIKLANVRWLV